tara:strand:+ start:24682 stop:24804 length:123 start_codon:yes stop_codon:yes gene_type:complete
MGIKDTNILFWLRFAAYSLLIGGGSFVVLLLCELMYLLTR